MMYWFIFPRQEENESPAVLAGKVVEAFWRAFEKPAAKHAR